MNELQKLKPKIVKVLRRNGIKKAGVFGSYATGKQKKGSDIDILAEAPKGINLYDFIGMKQDLESVLGKKVDLITYKGIRPELREEILASEVRIL